MEGVIRGVRICESAFENGQLWSEGFGGGLDLEAAGGSRDVERADGEELSDGEDRAAFEERLSDDGVLRTDSGVLFGEAGLLDFGAEAESSGGLVDRGVEVTIGEEVWWRAKLTDEASLQMIRHA